MKKLIVSISVISLIAFGCQKQKSTLPQDNSSNLELSENNLKNLRTNNSVPLTLNSIGQLHNLYLSGMINEVKIKVDRDGFSNFTNIDLKNVFNDIVLEDIITSEQNASSLKEFARKQLDMQLDNSPYDINKYNMDYISNSAFGSPIFKSIAKNLIYDVNVKGAEKMEVQIKDKYLKLLDQNKQKLTSTENDIILAGLSVMENSFNYWSKEDVIWVNTLNPEYQGVYAGGGGLGDGVGGADVGGCVAGGIAGAMIGGVVTIGAGTAPGWLVGALTGGISASEGQAAQNLWNKFF